MNDVKMEKIIYEGFFIDLSEMEQVYPGVLAKQIGLPHVTTAFRPKETSRSLYGRTVTIKVTGYAVGNENEGVKVDVITDDPSLQQLIDTIPVPHVTVSVSESGKPVNTAKLPFKAVEPDKEVMLTGTFGGFNGKNTVFK